MIILYAQPLSSGHRPERAELLFQLEKVP